MRDPLPLLSAAMLAACGSRESANPAEPAAAVAIPEPFLGVFDGAIEACTRLDRVRCPGGSG